MNLPDTIALGRLGGVVGKFRLEKKLGSGAMGDVYLGVHTTLGNHVAIKILNAAASAEVAGVERFLNEAHAVAKLGHENIVAVIDQDRLPDGTPFIVMEYVEGENVRDLLSRGPMSFARAARIATDVLAALAVAHANGVIHRDLKPENVRVTPNGRAKVLDFGVAKVLNKPSTQVTVQGAIVGTPHYMAPEQVASAPVDGRADVYAVGVMLFECATGHRPFDGESLVELLQQQMHASPPAPRSLRPEVPEPLERVILKALEKEPARRFSSAADMSAALAAVMPQLLPELATPPAPMAASSGGPVTATPSAAYVPTKREARASSSPQNAAELNSPFSSLPTTLRERTPNRMGLAMAAALAGLAAVVAAVTLGPWGGSLERPDAPRDAVAPTAPTVSPTPSLVVVAPGSATRPGPPPGDPDSPEAAPTSAAPLNRPVGDPDSLANPAALPHQPGAVDSKAAPTSAALPHRPVGGADSVLAVPSSGARPMKPEGDGSAAGGRRVALAEPSTTSSDYDPKHFDFLGFLPKATALAKAKMSDAVLVDLWGYGVSADGFADFTLHPQYDVTYVFRSPSRSVINPRLPERDQDVACKFYVIVNAREVEARVVTDSGGCRQPPLPPLACTMAEVMQRGVRQGLRTDRVAKVTYFADATWFINQGDDASESKSVVCP